MEAVGVLGGGGPSGSASSSHLSSTERACRSTGYSSCYVPCNRRSPRAAHLAALYSPSRLFSYSPSLLYDAKSRKAPKTHIFVPHLVASTEQVEETYIMVKPDGVQHGLVGEIISRFEKKGFKLTGLKLFQCPKELAEEHYKDLKGRPFFPKLINYIASGPVVCMAWEGVGVVASARKLIGSTDPLQAEPGTIRGDLAVQTGRNVVHGSDSPENGKREIALWFKEDEVCQWTPVLAPSEHSIIEACSFEEFSAKHLHFSLIHHLISQFRIILYQRMMKYSIFNLYEVPLRKFETCFSF